MDYKQYKVKIVQNVKRTIFLNKNDVLFANPEFSEKLNSLVYITDTYLMYDNRIVLPFDCDFELSPLDAHELFNFFGFNISIETIVLLFETQEWAGANIQYYDYVQDALISYLVTICAFYETYSDYKIRISDEIKEKYAHKGKFFNHVTPDKSDVFYNPFSGHFNRTENWFIGVDYAFKANKDFKVDSEFTLDDIAGNKNKSIPVPSLKRVGEDRSNVIWTLTRVSAREKVAEKQGVDYGTPLLQMTIVSKNGFVAKSGNFYKYGDQIYFDPSKDKNIDKPFDIKRVVITGKTAMEEGVPDNTEMLLFTVVDHNGFTSKKGIHYEYGTYWYAKPDQIFDK